jgi:sugar/nucleoside kinase (ribokinase family)
MRHFSIIGAAHLDALVEGIDEPVVREGSHAAGQIRLSFGGDALNEAVTLSRLGGKVDLVSKVGYDSGGDMALAYCRENGLDTAHIFRKTGLATSLNIVLIDTEGERSFITDPHSSLRALTVGDVLPYVETLAPMVCFASLFVFPKFDSQALETLFSGIKKKGCVLCADMTKRKNGETLADLGNVWPYIDILFANAEEAGLLSDHIGTAGVARDFRRYGVKCMVVKTGKEGCFIDSDEVSGAVPGCRCENCVDTTGAGDNFAAGFLFARASGSRLIDCARFGNAIASLCVEHVGATAHTIRLDDVLERCRVNYPDFDESPYCG